jgi:hypothetical protein
MQEPFKVDADAPKVTELIGRFGDLQATGPDVLDASDLKPYALDAPTGPRVTLTIVEKDKPDLPQAVTLRVGKDDVEKKKLAVQVAGNPRVALVNDDFWKLFDRPAIVYRSKRRRGVRHHQKRCRMVADGAGECSGRCRQVDHARARSRQTRRGRFRGRRAEAERISAVWSR